MQRIFENVSPFGELIDRGRIVAVGETVTVDENRAEGYACQPLNWAEVDEDGNRIVHVPAIEPEAEVGGSVEDGFDETADAEDVPDEPEQPKRAPRASAKK